MSVKVSSKFQIIIPEPVRRCLKIKAGTQIEVILKQKVAYLVPVLKLQTLISELKGKINPNSLRDKKS